MSAEPGTDRVAITVTRLVDRAGQLRALEYPTFSLEVTAGPAAGLSKTFETQARVLVGSGGGAALALSDSTVSAAHCELVLDEAGLRVVDLESKNGVVVAGHRVREAWLVDGDVLTLGSSRVRVSFGGARSEQRLEARTSMGPLTGGSIAMRTLYGQLAKVAAHDVAVLMVGETGTGKDCAVEALVQAGPRAQQPLVVLSCGAVPAGLFESELFGHVKGAFTGAHDHRKGVFERASGGTLVLDQVNELPLELQPKLLRVVETRRVRPLGASSELPVDVRLISTSQRPLEPEVNRGAFRADLYFRLSAVTLRVPALRERAEDIPQLVSQFLEERGVSRELPPALLRQLLEATYPGNVRELKGAVERAVLGLEVKPASLTGLEQLRLELDQPFYPQRDRLFAELEKRYLRELLEKCGGNVSQVARRSGITRVHLYTLLRKHGLLAG